MDGFGSILLADAATPAVSTTTRYQWTQWQAFTEWWQAPLLMLDRGGGRGAGRVSLPPR